MTNTESSNLRLWIILLLCIACALSFGLGIYIGIGLAQMPIDAPEENTIEATDVPVETAPETTEKNNGFVSGLAPIPELIDDAQAVADPVTKETEPTIPETVPKPTEPVIEETEYYEPEPTKSSSETVSKPTIEETKPDTEMSELEMLACVIYQEAGGSSHCDDCRRRVADVVLNRVASGSFPDTIYEVLTQRSQYGRFYWTGIKWADRATNPYEAKNVERAWRIAEEVMNGQHSDVYGKGYVWQAEFVQGSDGFWCCGHFFGRY